MKKRLSVSELKALIRYDEHTGHFYWRVTRGWRCIAETRAGSIGKQGYIQIKIFGTYYKGHRLAWAFKTGKHPRHDVEHRNLNKANNEWKNLRKTDDFKNQANTPLRADSTTGFKSVCFRKDSKKYRARIQKKNKRIALGSFNTAEEAHAAYAKAAKKLFGDFARTS